MASAAQIYTMIQTVVEGHATHNTFYSIWNPAKDDPSQVQYPCVIEHRYIGKVVENTDLGIRYRSQLVQLLVITTVSTERTVAQRAAAVHAADTAALEIALALEATYKDFVKVSGLSITPEWDEGRHLQTGVMLTFTVTDLEGICVDAEPGELPTIAPASFILDDLTDVDAPSPTDGQLLAWSDAEQQWVPVDPSSGGGGGVTDHGALNGLGDDDHTQYHNNARGDVRYDALGAASAAQAAAIAAAANPANITQDATHRFTTDTEKATWNALIGGSVFQTVWNATTNSPALASGTGTKGHYYIVNVAGSTNLDGITDWKVGDWAIFDGTVWRKVDNTDAVSSVNGLTGAVTLDTSNVSDTSNKRYVTDAQLVVIGNTSGTNTGDQDLSPYQTIASLAAAVRSTVLTGLSLATNQAIAAGDSILQALGYLQAQITALAAVIAGKADVSTKTDMAYTGGSVGSTGTALIDVDSSAKLSLSSVGLWEVRIKVTYNANVTTTGAFFSLNTDGTLAADWIACLVNYTTGSGDRDGGLIAAFNGGVAVASSVVTTGNGAFITGEINVTTVGDVLLRFASEIATANSITVTNVTGWARKKN